ncbi:MAG: peptide chain release factor 2 [Patescibacteria group bacterium]|nr:peptide chain release factor 2 [Patescibacteria group bacterium]MDD5554892.1 peptide chain release factor 2 [Patescibacteria group bacterium]
MENLLKKIEELRERLLKTWRLLDIDGKKSEVRDKKLEMSKPDFWKNRERAVEISQKAEELGKEIGGWEELLKETTELEELVAVGNKEEDFSLAEEVESRYEELLKKFEGMEFQVMFSGKYDENNAILSVHAGTGGVEAQDWAEMLERMFLRFAEKRGWKAEILDRTVGNEAGIKSMSMRIAGRWAYGYLKSESGVHRLVRISPFDAEQMRHTSFALVEVIPELPEAENIEIKNEDLRIDVYRSSGPGGQSVNTTDSAVRIVHKPTNITVTCQTQRSQHQNKITALKILKSKLYKLQEEEKENTEKKLRGEAQKAEWGKQIRSYVMQPYKMVKDHRTDYETSDVNAVLNGELEPFMESYLRETHNG